MLGLSSQNGPRAPDPERESSQGRRYHMKKKPAKKKAAKK
jgi:hypothetical protein